MVWTPPQAGIFLDYAEAHDVLYALFLLILRRGEACGLRDVDLAAGHAAIAQQITTVGYRPVTKPVKTDAGDRIVPLGVNTLAALNDYRALRDRWQTVSADQWPNTGLFFVQPDGNAWHPQTVSQRFD